MLEFKSEIPNIGNVSSDPIIILGVALMALGIVIPCLIWFVRNIYRVAAKKDYWWLNKTLKYSWIVGIFILLIGLVILVSKLFGV